MAFQTGEGRDSILDGFTLTNGTGTLSGQHFYGGAIYCDTSSPKIFNNTIIANSAESGGGIFCDDSDPKIIGNTITDNTASHSGGGIFYLDGDPIITDNTISLAVFMIRSSFSV